MSDLSTSNQIVFLVDTDKSLHDDSTSCPQKVVNTICLSALRLLLYFASENEGLMSCKSSKCRNKQNSLKWGFKFFNSSYHHSRIGGHTFRDFKLRYFEEFENEVERKFEEVQSQQMKFVASDCVRKALMEIIHDFQWEKPDITSPVKQTRKNRANTSTKTDKDVKNTSRNLVFLFSKVPQNPRFLRQFAGKKVIDAEICLESFMPQNLLKEFHGLYQLRLFWVDCYNIMTRPDVDLASLKLFEESLSKIGGHLLPAEFLVQLCHTYITNVGSVTLSQSSKQNGNDQTRHSPENCKLKDVRKNSDILCPVLPYFPVIENFLLDWKGSAYKRQANAGHEEQQHCISLLTQNGQKFCELEIMPMHRSGRSRQLISSEDNTEISIEKGTTLAQAWEDHIQRTSLLAKGGTDSLRVCAILSTQARPQLNETMQEEYICTACTKEHQLPCSTQFNNVLALLSKVNSCLVLEVQGRAAFMILKPLTTMSATLSSLTLRKTILLEKSLHQWDTDIMTPENQTVQNSGEPWTELVARINAKQQIQQSGADKQRACFNPLIVEKSYLPGSHQSFGRLLDKLSKKISQLNILNKDELKTLSELQKLYRYENQPLHSRNYTHKDSAAMGIDSLKEKQGTSEDGKKNQGSVASRGEMMVTRSRQAVNQKGKDNQCSTKSEIKDKDRPKTNTTVNTTDFADEGELKLYIQDVYKQAICNGTLSLNVCAQTLVTVSLHYCKENCKDKPEETCKQLLEPCIILPLNSLREKYLNCSSDIEKQQKIKEYQLQVILRLECESMLPATDESRVDQIVNLLRTLGFITDPATLTEFMEGTLVDQYVHSLPHVLGSIYDELMQPLPDALEAILSPNHSADQSVLNQSLTYDNPGSNQSGIGETSQCEPSSNKSDVLLNRTKRNTRSRSLVHHPSLADVGPKRQIMVKKVDKKKDKRSQKKSHSSKKKSKDTGGSEVCRSLFENRKTKLERRQSVAVMEGVGQSKHHSRRHPNLKSPKALKSPFKSPSYRQKKVSETPAHKQKCQAIFSRIEKERHRSQSVTSVQIVEESPVKSCAEQRDSPSQRKRALALLRRSFYSAGPTKKSRNLTKYFQLADRIAGRPPMKSGLHDLSVDFTSPDKNNSSLIFSQLMGSPTPPKSTPSKLSVTPAKHLLESPSMNTRSKTDGTPRKSVLADARVLQSPSMNTRSKSPGFSLGRPKVLFRETFSPVASSASALGLSDRTKSSDSKCQNSCPRGTPSKEGTSLAAESPSQNTRSKSITASSHRTSRAKMFLFKSPENQQPSKSSNSPSISTSKCLNLSKFENTVGTDANKDVADIKENKAGVINVSWLEKSGMVGGICIRDPCGSSEGELIPNTQTTPHHRHTDSCSETEKTPSPRKQTLLTTTPNSLDKWPRKKKFHSPFQSPKYHKVSQLSGSPNSPRTQLQHQQLNVGPQNTQSPLSSKSSYLLSPRHCLSQETVIRRSPRVRSKTVGDHNSQILGSPGDIVCKVREKQQVKNVTEKLSSASNMQECIESLENPHNHESMEVDNESIFSELSQGSERRESVLSCVSPVLRKRSFNISPDTSSVFSPSKRRKVSHLHTVKESEQKLPVSYCLHSHIISGQNSSFESISSQTSLGFQAEGIPCLSQKSIPSLSQSSVDSNDYFSLSNDEVFLSRKPKTSTDTSRSESPVFGSVKKDKTRSLVYKHVNVVENLSSSGLSSQDSSPHVNKSSPTVSNMDMTKQSPVNRKYSPCVSAKSLMHLMHSPLITSPEGHNPQFDQNNLNVRRQRMHGKSKRSLNLQK